MTRVQIVFYSMYGHVHLLAEAVAEGARRVPGAEVSVFQVPELGNVDGITGGTPYGASTVAKLDGSRLPSANELAIARFQGEHATAIGQRLARPWANHVSEYLKEQ